MSLRYTIVAFFCSFSVVLADDLANSGGAAGNSAAMAPSVAAAAAADSHDEGYKKFTEYMDDYMRVKLGAGLRTSFRTVENGAPNGSTASKSFQLDNMRLYVNGKILDYIGVEFNTEIGDGVHPGAEDVGILDAVVKLEASDLFNIWAGRFLPPSDRSNLDGPFFLNAYDFPLAQAYPARFAGRDTGIAYWGQVKEGMFKWQAGAFEGSNAASNQKDHPLFAGRLVLNLLDPEPGYYNSSTYYGSKDVLAVGLAGMYQQDHSGTLGETNDFGGFNVDVLFEKKLTEDIVDSQLLTDGVATLEGAYYVYDDNDLDDDFGNPTLVGGPASRQGESFLILASFLFPTQFGVGVLQGQLQPYFRYQRYNRALDAPGLIESGIDTGVNYVLDGHNARISLFYSGQDPQGGSTIDSAVLAGQFQF